MREYNSFTEEEKKAIGDLNRKYFYAEMSDCYANTISEERNALNDFNKKFGYDFHRFVSDFSGDISKVWFD